MKTTQAVKPRRDTLNLRIGLDESPLEPMTLMVTIADLRAAME